MGNQGLKCGDTGAGEITGSSVKGKRMTDQSRDQDISYQWSTADQVRNSKGLIQAKGHGLEKEGETREQAERITDLGDLQCDSSTPPSLLKLQSWSCNTSRQLSLRPHWAPKRNKSQQEFMTFPIICSASCRPASVTVRNPFPSLRDLGATLRLLHPLHVILPNRQPVTKPC